MVHEKVDALYQHNVEVFASIEKIFHSAHGVPFEITRNNIKQRILAEINNEREKILLSSKRGILKSFFNYYKLIIFLVSGSVFGSRKRQVSSVVMFDCWYTNSLEFYEDIIANLKTNSILYFLNDSHKNQSSCCTAPNQIQQSGKRIKLFSKRASMKVLRSHFSKFIEYWNLSRKTDLNIFDLIVRMIYEVGKHISMVDGINTSMLVSAHDNGYSPYRYYFYKKYGIDSIMLLQNGGRVDLDASYNSYIYADYYMAWTKHRLDMFTEMHCFNKFTPGSVRLSNRLNKYTGDAKLEYDILFVEQFFINQTGVRGAPDNEAYLVGIDNLLKFKQRHSQFRVAYGCRPGRNNDRASILVHDINSKLKNSEVIMLKLEPLEIYDIILRSSVVLAFNSSVRCEALMLKKIAMTCNYTGYENDYVVNNSCDDVVINSDKYNEFESKILGALNKLKENDSADYYKNNNGMNNVVYNSSTEIADIISLRLGL
jgi:hypothetical protein